MKLNSILLLPLISSVTWGEQANFQAENNSDTTETNNSNTLANTLSSTNTKEQWDATPFCKMDKDEKIGPECDITISEINEINQHIRNDLVSLVQTDFFKYFKFDPLKKCTIWENNDGLCFSRSCAIDVVEDWDSLPEYWQPEVLGKLNDETNNVNVEGHKDSAFLDQLCDNNGKNKNNLDRLPLEDEDDINYYDINDFTSENAVLVDLSANPERFTGYGGQQAGQIWKSIYAENCFNVDDENEKCLAKDAFFRIVSGLHASIGTHLSNDHLNTETGQWGPDLDLFMARVGNFPDRVSNIYFNYAIVGKALWKIKPYLKELDFCSDYDNNVKSKILNIVSQLDNHIFDEDLMFKGEVDTILKDDFRRRFKNVTKIMDCVHCDRCKMWGKVQTTGYATSLKILFELDEADELSKQRVVNKLTKFELISLLNTFDRLSKSIESINNFEKMYNDRLTNEEGNNVASFFQNNFFKLLGKAKNTFGKLTNNSAVNENNKLDEIKHGELKKEKVSETEDEKKEEIEKEVPVSNKKRENDKSSNKNEALQKKNKATANKKNKYTDVKLPKKKQQSLAQDKDNSMRVRIKKAWDTEIHNYFEAIKFIWRSYLDLPRNLFKILLNSFVKLWNTFIGFTGYITEEDEEPFVYELDIQ